MTKPMTVGELRTLLEGMPADMELIQTRCSDYSFQTADMWSVVEAIYEPGKYWLTRTHPRMSPRQLASAKKYLHIEGN